MTDKAPEGKTHAERMLELDELQRQQPPHRQRDIREDVLKYWDAHIERLRLIYAPFPVVRRLGTGSAMPWAGTIVGDTFYGDGLTRRLAGKGGYAREWRETGDGLEWDDYAALAGVT